MTTITTNNELAGFLRAVNGAEFLAIDTEFIRERTYWPQLCLVQAAGPDCAAVIDPLAPGLDLAPLFEMLTGPSLKILHAARQDMELLLHYSGRLPKPVFDTQIAAQVCGFGESAAYETLVRQLAGIEIDKSLRFTDWAKRPLSPEQTAYALGDVTHLRTVYKKLQKILEDSGRTSWIAEEMAALDEPERYIVKPEDAWRRLKPRSNKPRFLALVREISAWRECEARRRDVPRRRILRDETILEIASSRPSSIAALGSLRLVGKGVAESKLGASIMECVAKALALPEDTLPAPEAKNLASPDMALLQLLKVLLRYVAEDQHVAPRMIVESGEIELLASGIDENLRSLTGWRYEIFGESALALCRGDLALTCANKQLVLLRADGEGSWLQTSLAGKGNRRKKGKKNLQAVKNHSQEAYIQEE